MLEQAATRTKRFYKPKHNTGLPKAIRTAKGRAMPVAMIHSSKIDALTSNVTDFMKSEQSAFGVDHKIAKAGGELVRVAAKTRTAGGASYKIGATKIRRPRRVGAGSAHEFGRAVRGAAQGNFARHTMLHRSNIRKVPGAKANMNAGYKRAREKQQQASSRPAAFATGAHIGHAAGAAGAHPYMTYGAVAGSAVGAGVVHDVREVRAKKRKYAAAKARKLAREQAASTTVVKGAGAVAGVAGGLVALQAGANEAWRRHYNKKGANVRPSGPYAHPYKTKYKYAAASQKAKAPKLDTKARNPEYSPQKQARLKNRANKYRWASNANNQAGMHGAIVSRTTGGYGPYDKTKKYKSPTTIGKARGVPKEEPPASQAARFQGANPMSPGALRRSASSMGSMNGTPPKKVNFPQTRKAAKKVAYHSHSSNNSLRANVATGTGVGAALAAAQMKTKTLTGPPKEKALTHPYKFAGGRGAVRVIGRTPGGRAARLVSAGAVVGAAATHRKSQKANRKNTIVIKRAMSDTQLRHRNKVQAGITTAGATIGLAALGTKAGGSVARKLIKPAAKGEKIAERMERHTTGLLTAGAGLGGVGGFNAAAIYRQEAKRPKPVVDVKTKKVVEKGLIRNVRQVVENAKKASESGAKISSDTAEMTHKVKRLIPNRKVGAAAYGTAVAVPSAALYAGSYKGTKSAQKHANKKGPVVKKADPLVQQYGLRGSPKGVDRTKRQQIWEARAKHLNTKRDRWHKTSRGANVAEKTSGAVAGGVGGLTVGSLIREKYRDQNPGKVEHAAARIYRAGTKAHLSPSSAARAARVVSSGSPGYKTLAVGAGATVAAAGAARLRTTANKKTRKYSSASGGIASGTSTRMKDYSHE